MKGISLFASGGIGDLALRAVGVDVILSNEILHDRAQIFMQNFPECEMLVGDIWDLKESIIATTKDKLKGAPLDFMLATPPCQGMSKNGRGKLLSIIRKGERPELDPRNQLIIPTVEIVKALLPNTIVFENVPEMKDTLIDYQGNLINIISFIKSELEPLGYVGTEEVVEFANYGVPQRRQRLITIFSRDPELVNYFQQSFSYLPEPTHSNQPGYGQKPWVSVYEVIGALPKLNAKSKTLASHKNIPFHRVPILDEEKYFWVSNTPPEAGAFDNQCSKCGHNENVIHGASKDKEGINRSNTATPIYCENCGELLPRPWVKQNGEYRLMKGYTSAYRRMKWNLPATALTTNLSYACSDSKLHPEQNRVLSLYEAFIIHTIDKYKYDWIRADGKGTSDKLIREIIGESVPPYGLEKILNHLIELSKSNLSKIKLKQGQTRLFKEPEMIYNLVPEL